MVPEGSPGTVTVSEDPGPTWAAGAPVPLRVSNTRVGPVAEKPLPVGDELKAPTPWGVPRPVGPS